MRAFGRGIIHQMKLTVGLLEGLMIGNLAIQRGAYVKKMAYGLMVEGKYLQICLLDGYIINGI